MNAAEAKSFPHPRDFLDETVYSPKPRIIRPVRTTAPELIIEYDRPFIR